MKFTSPHSSLQLNILSYEFLSASSLPGEFDYDANWLECRIDYTEGNLRKTYYDSCLLTTELRELADELSAIIDGRSCSYISDFMEPYLKIAFIRTEAGISAAVHFVYDTSDGWKTRKVVSVLGPEDAKALLDELKSFTERFPVR